MCVCVCVSMCPPPRALITSGVIWCDIGCVRLVKQVLRLSPAFNYFIKTHSSVSAAKKTKEDARHTSVLFTGTVKLPNSAFCISKTTLPISTKFTYFLPYIYIHMLLHISNLKDITLVVLEIFVPENCPIFFTFFFFAQNYKYI